MAFNRGDRFGIRDYERRSARRRDEVGFQVPSGSLHHLGQERVSVAIELVEGDAVAGADLNGVDPSGGDAAGHCRAGQSEPVRDLGRA